PICKSQPLAAVRPLPPTIESGPTTRQVAAQVSLAGFLRQQRTQDAGPLIRWRLDWHPNREGYSAPAFVRDNLVLWRIVQLISGRDFFQLFATAHRARWGAFGHFRIMTRSTIPRNKGEQPTMFSGNRRSMPDLAAGRAASIGVAGHEWTGRNGKNRLLLGRILGGCLAVKSAPGFSRG